MMFSPEYQLLKKEISLKANNGQRAAAYDESGALGGKAGRIYSEIERRLATGYYKFGEEISTTKLVAEFGGSRAPVTTALNLLRADGYLVIIPQVGCRVVNPDDNEIKDFFLMFSQMEGVAAKLAAARHTTAQLNLLKDIERRLLAETPKGDEKVSPFFIELVALFHELIHSMADSPRISSQIAGFWGMSEFFLWNAAHQAREKHVDVINAQRHEIINAIAARDEQKAQDLMVAHINDKPKLVGGL